MCSPSVFLIHISRQFIHLLLQMADNPIPTQPMILLIDVLHDLPITDRIIPLLDILLVPSIEPIPQQRHHRSLQGVSFLLVLLDLLSLLPVLPSNQSHQQNANLLYPVFLDRLPYNAPIQWKLLLFRSW